VQNGEDNVTTGKRRWDLWGWHQNG